MKTERFFAVLSCVLIVPVFFTGFLDGKEKKKPKNDVCSVSTPGSICNAENTCGSAASPCEVDIKRSGGDSASATPNITGAKENAPFCVKTGTTITFKSTSKDTGLVLGLRHLLAV